MDCSPPGSSVHAISQARILKWAALSFSRASNQHLMHWQSNSLPLSHTWEAQKLYYKTVFPTKQCLGSDICEMNELSLSVYGLGFNYLQILLAQSSVQFSHSVLSNSLRPHGLQHARLPCPSPTPEAYSNSCPSSQWCHPTISSSMGPFSAHPQSFSASGSFQMSQFFASGGQSTGVAASASVLPMNIQGWFPLAPRGWLSLQSNGLSKSVL